MSRNTHMSEAAPRPRGPYSHAASVGGLLATAGASGTRPGMEWEPVADDVGDQTRQAMCNLDAILNAAGASFDDVIRAWIYLTRPEDYARVNEAYREFFSEPFPARTTVYVGLPPKILVEIDLLAAIPTSS